MARKKKPINVLVVDDEQFFAEWLAENLQDQPNLYNARWVNSGERALEFIERQPVDLVISDIKMAGVSGIELLKQIREQRPGIGVILMTGYALPELQQEAVKRGSLLYLEKPFPMERLESAIEQAMAGQPIATKPEPPDSLEPESATQLSLLDTLHLFHLSRANKMLLVRASANEGLIYYQDGEVVHAVSQDQSGESAFRQIVSWQSDDFAVFTDEPPPNRSIFRDFDTLLNTAMEPAFSIEDRGLQIEDLSDQPVSDQLAEAPPPEPAIDVEPIITEFAPMPVESPTQEEDVSAPTLVEAPVQEYEPVIAEFVQQTEEAPAPLFVEEQQSPGIMEPEGQGAKEPESQEAISSAPVPLQTVASSVAQMPGFTAEEKRHLEELLMASDHLEGGALLTIDGLILASTISHKALKSSLLVEAGSLFQICRRLASELGRGNHRQSFIQGDLGNIIVSDVGAGSYLLFVTNAKATLGMALLQARQRAQKVSQLMANYAS